MTSRTILLTSFASLALLGSLAAVTPASALTMKECSTKYKAAQAAGTLNGQKWNDFRAAQCNADAAAAPAAPAAAAPAAAAPTAPTKATTAAAKPTAAKTDDEPDAAVPPAKEPAKPTVAAPAGLSLPSAVSPKYASETEGKARFHTCVDAYHDAKAKNALAGVKWIQKGGGYYSLCNAKLKG